MSKVNVIKILILIENFLGIYRNYAFLKKSIKYFVQIRILTDLFLILFPYVFLFCVFYGYSYSNVISIHDYFIVYYVSFQTANSVGCIVLSVVNTKYFENFVKNIKTTQRLLDSDILYQVAKRDQVKKNYVSMTLFTVGMFFMTLLYAYDSYLNNVLTVGEYLLKISHHYRYFYENYVFAEFIQIILVNLTFLNDTVSVTSEKFDKEIDEIDELEALKTMQEKIKIWNEINSLLGSAINNLSNCFGTQVMVTTCCKQALLYDSHHPAPGIANL